VPSYEYSVIPAPKRGVKGKGIKGAEAQFANALTKLMNEAAVEGWEYLRAETLPSEERQGLTGRTTVFQNMLVFRRATAVAEPAPEPAQAPPLDQTAPEPPRVEPQPPAAPTESTVAVDADPDIPEFRRDPKLPS